LIRRGTATACALCVPPDRPRRLGSAPGHESPSLLVRCTYLACM
jgi:hypothetical protein